MFVNLPPNQAINTKMTKTISGQIEMPSTQITESQHRPCDANRATIGGMMPLNHSFDSYFQEEPLQYEPLSPLARSEHAYTRQQLLSKDDAVSIQDEVADQHAETLDGLRLYHTIGEGGTSVVKLGRMQDNSEVAVKLLNPDLEESVHKLALSEFDMMQDLDCNYVLKLVGKGRGLHCNQEGAMQVDYGVFEYAVNGELFDMVQTAGGFEEPLARHYFG